MEDYQAILAKQEPMAIYRRVRAAMIISGKEFQMMRRDGIDLPNTFFHRCAVSGKLPEIKWLKIISEYCQISLLWLIHGRGDMFSDAQVIKIEPAEKLNSFDREAMNQYLKPHVLDTQLPVNFSFVEDQPKVQTDILKAALELKQAIDSLAAKFINGTTYESLYQDTITAFVKARYDAKKSDSKFIAWCNRLLARFDLMIVSASEYGNMHGQLHVLSHTMRD